MCRNSVQICQAIYKSTIYKLKFSEDLSRNSEITNLKVQIQ